MDLNEIATRAANFRYKTKKEDAFQIVRELAEKPVDPESLAKLYAFFMPPLPAKAKGFKWVARAMGQNDVRYYLNYVHSEGSRVVATDGHRLHLMPGDLPAGYYDKAETQCNVAANYPDIDRVIPPRHQAEEKYNLHEILHKLPVVEVGGVKVKTHAYVLPDGSHVNKRYLDQAVAKDEPAILRLYEDGRPARIDFEDGRLAVIMPMRV